MLIAILVLLGIAALIWYFASTQSKAINVVLSENDIKASVPSFDEQEAKLKEEQLANLAAVQAKPTTPVEETPVVEVPKPAKKKRRYYPKKK